MRKKVKRKNSQLMIVKFKKSQNNLSRDLREILGYYKKSQLIMTKSTTEKKIN